MKQRVTLVAQHELGCLLPGKTPPTSIISDFSPACVVLLRPLTSRLYFRHLGLTARCERRTLAGWRWNCTREIRNSEEVWGKKVRRRMEDGEKEER